MILAVAIGWHFQNPRGKLLSFMLHCKRIPRCTKSVDWCRHRTASINQATVHFHTTTLVSCLCFHFQFDTFCLTPEQELNWLVYRSVESVGSAMRDAEAINQLSQSSNVLQSRASTLQEAQKESCWPVIIDSIFGESCPQRWAFVLLCSDDLL